jgi:hypothetical protein
MFASHLLFVFFGFNACSRASLYTAMKEFKFDIGASELPKPFYYSVNCSKT